MEFKSEIRTPNDSDNCECPACVAGKLSAGLLQYGIHLDTGMQLHHINTALQAVYTPALAN